MVGLIYCSHNIRKHKIYKPIYRKDDMMRRFEVLRAQEAWQKAGAYFVRVQGMDRKYHISLREEFDEHDGDGCRYIVLTEYGFPVATCRFYELDKQTVLIGRVVVLPEYRGMELGRMVITEAEKWIVELGYTDICLDSRTVAIGFYEKLGYSLVDNKTILSWKFDCKRMHKELSRNMSLSAVHA